MASARVSLTVARLAAPVEAVPRIAWDEHMRFMRGEWVIDGKANPHISLIATAGDGKTVLWRELLTLHADRRIGVLDIKGDDPELRPFRPVLAIPTRLQRHATRLASVRHEAPREHYRLVIPDPFRHRNDARERVERALNTMYDEGDWIVAADEIRALTDARVPGLGLPGHVEQYWIRGRTRRVALIACTQGPRWVPGSFYDQSRFLYISGLTDVRAERRLAEVGGARDRIMSTLPTLQQHEFLFIADKGRTMAIVRVPWPPPSRRRRA